MRTLKFLVNNQILKEDPKCDFNDLIPGTEGYLRVEFSFSPEWNGFNKVVSFWSTMGKEYLPRTLSDGKSCIVPWEAVKRRKFKIQVIGERNGLKLTTNKVVINQNGGRS